MKHLSTEELEAGLDDILRSPKNSGAVKMIVRRPEVDEREVLEQGDLDIIEGLIGDSWGSRQGPGTHAGSAHPEMQLNLMNSRVIALVATRMERWPLAGDQFFLDLDLSKSNLPAGAQLEIGSAVIEITEMPHTGCKKFAARFGVEATKFVNSRRGKELRLRGVNAKIVKPGVVRVGDRVGKVL